MTRIELLQNTGIARTGSPRGGFKYRRADGRKPGSSDLARIRKLKIPPAWTDVSINIFSEGKLQAVGRDKAHRWQYLYHENHTKAQARRKYRRLVHFMEDLPKMRMTVARHLRQPGLGREKILACILRILSTCFLRPGSEVYASEHGSYGIATLRPEHISVTGDVVRFDFPGKSGVRQVRELKDRQAAGVLKALLKCRKSEVFKYESEDGEFVDIKRRHINEYIKEVMGHSFSAKDFRTWAGTVVCACALAGAGTDELETTSSRKQKISHAIKTTAITLGNTPAVCRSSYIYPGVIECFEKGETIKEFFSSTQDFIAYRGLTLHAAERALLKLLK
jgi:DNA topoisomerase I